LTKPCYRRKRRVIGAKTPYYQAELRAFPTDGAVVPPFFSLETVMDISFKFDPEAIIGLDTISRAGTICAAYGKRALIVTGQTPNEQQGVARLKGILEDSQIEAIVFDEVSRQAAADTASTAASLCRGARCSLVIGFGGMKVQTIARMSAIIASSGVPVFDLLDGCSAGPEFLPYIAIPTTSGDPFLFSDYFIAVDPRDRTVKQIQSPAKLCAVVIIDSGVSGPPAVSFAAAAFGGFCFAIEAYCSARANLLSDTLLERAIVIYARIMKSNTDNAEFDAAVAAANAGYLLALGAASSAPGIGTALSYALNGRFQVLKSQCAAVLLPYIMERLIASRPEKMAKVTTLMGEAFKGGTLSDSANQGAESIRRLMTELNVPTQLQDFNLSMDRLAPVAESARSLGFVTFSPWTVSSEDAFELLKQAF
jgi:alcohol dehydrogenase